MTEESDPDSEADPETDFGESPRLESEAQTAGREVLDELFVTIESRKAELPEDSYTASLFTHEKGENAVLEKLGEETTEFVLAAKDDDTAEMTHEAADIVYHLLVALSMQGLELSDLRAELRDRYAE